MMTSGTSNQYCIICNTVLRTIVANQHETRERESYKHIMNERVHSSVIGPLYGESCTRDDFRHVFVTVPKTEPVSDVGPLPAPPCIAFRSEKNRLSVILSQHQTSMSAAVCFVRETRSAEKAIRLVSRTGFIKFTVKVLLHSY